MPLDFDQFFQPVHSAEMDMETEHMLPYGEPHSMVYGNQGEIPRMAMTQMDSEFEFDFNRFFNDPAVVDPFCDPTFDCMTDPMSATSGMPGMNRELYFKDEAQFYADGLERFLQEPPEVAETDVIAVVGQKRGHPGSHSNDLRDWRGEHSTNGRIPTSVSSKKQTKTEIKSELDAKMASHYLSDRVEFDQDIGQVLPTEIPTVSDGFVHSLTPYSVERSVCSVLNLHSLI